MNYAFGYVLLTNFVITTISISTSISVFISNKSCKDVRNRPKQHLFVTPSWLYKHNDVQSSKMLLSYDLTTTDFIQCVAWDHQTGKHSSQLASSWWETCTSKERTGNLEKLALLSEANEKRDFQRTFRRSTCRKTMKKLHKHKRSTKNRSKTCL